ncbi:MULTISPECIES: YfiR family protein [unclassified Massilia]|uniref:YfiR family protein n=1 Tax=unclassified Massilia TaxID=2609279 RepID=UPI0009E87A22|nr:MULTISPECIES: YfiR family protein [unclassified Massilia]
MHRHPSSSPNRGLRRRLAGWTLLCAAALCVENGIVSPARAENAVTSPALERRVKAAFLYKFLGYAEFPSGAFADAASPVVIGVVGADELATELARIVSGRTVNGRPITVRVLRESEIGTPVHLLFIGGNDAGRVGRLVRAAGGAMLVVTECDGGLQLGSAINFRIVDERVRFDVALDAAERNGIKLSSRLLTVANRVQKGAQQ